MDKKIWGWIAVGAGLLALLVLYGPVLKSPNSFMFGADGDAVKNYFAYAWHVRYDNDWIHFGGTNYPYGDHVCYTDGHPIVSLILQNFEWAKHYPVGTLNLLMLFSQIVGIGVVYLLLTELGIKRYIACLGGLSMVWLQPNMFRMLGHLSLSYVWVIPLALYLFVKYWNSLKPAWLVALQVYCIALFFLHPYYGMMISLLPFCVGITDWVIEALKRNFLMRSVYLISVGIIAPLFYLVFLKLTDTHPQRPDKALGFLLNASSIDDILVPSLPPFKHLMSQVIKVERQNWEGSAYIGIATMLILLVYSIIQIVNYKKIRFNANSMLMRLLCGGGIILLFSFGFPFKYGYENWLKHVPFIEQFRAPGRFAWVFFFIIVSFAFSILNTWCVQLHRHKKTMLAYLLPMMVFGLFFTEGYIAQTGTAEKAQKNLNTLTENPRYIVHENLKKIKEQQFAAIVPVPFFLYGTDYLFLTSNYHEQKYAYELAFQSGTPLMASANPRASLIETGNILNFFSPPFVNRQIFDRIETTEKFYVFNHSGNSDIQHNYYLPRNKSSLSMQAEISLYASLNNAIKNLVTLKLRELLSDYYQTNFSLRIQFTNGKLQAIKAKANQIIGLDSCMGKEFSRNESYEASVLLYAPEIHKASIEFLLEQTKPDAKVIKQTTLYETFNYYGDSAMCRLCFVAPDSGTGFRFILKGMRDNAVNFSYANFLLRKKDELVIEIDTTSSIKRISRINNYQIP